MSCYICRAMRLLNSSVLTITLAFGASCAPATAGGEALGEEIAPLERRFLGHSFDKDSQDKRLSRLEQLVFGEASQGDPAARLKRLDDAARSAAGGDDIDSPPTPPKKASQHKAAPPSPAPSKPAVSEPAPGGEAEPDPYPRIGALEKFFEGKASPGDDLNARLSRMETKVFGKPATGDLGDRTDALEKIAERKTHKPLVGQHTDAQTDSEYEEDEKPSKVPMIVNTLGNVLAGLSSMATPAGGFGFGGVRMRPRSEVQPKEEDYEPGENEIPDMVEDPQVRQPFPPPATARDQIKVGWCEFRLFGRTFPHKHLGERLEQINGELEFKPGKGAFALMDDIDAMVKKVAGRKMPINKEIGAAQPKPL
ncbi:MAG: hypothetical protein AB7W16_01525 [Candidatus Obscuribacterales bacterium]